MNHTVLQVYTLVQFSSVRGSVCEYGKEADRKLLLEPQATLEPGYRAKLSRIAKMFQPT